MVENVLYVCVSGYGGVTYAFNASDGAVRWQRETDCAIVSVPFGDYAQPVLANGLLYTGQYALSPDTGAVRWQMPLDASVGAVVDGIIYAYSEETISALTASSGAVRWQYQLTTPISALPIVALGKVYVGDMNGNSPPASKPGLSDAHALDAHTGALLWSYPSGIVTSLTADPAQDLVFVGTDSGGVDCGLLALEATTGALRWQDTTGPGSVSAPNLEQGTLYLTADGAYALNAQDGTIRWHNALFASPSTWFTPSTVLNGMMYVGQTDGSGNSTLYALSTSDGSVRWHVGGINQLSPPIAG